MAQKTQQKRGRRSTTAESGIADRSKSFFHRLLRDGTRADERIPLSQLRRAFYDALDTRQGVPDKREVFKRYYDGERVPTGETAWKIGESLRKIGCSWSSGITTLIAFGHMHRAIVALALWAERQRHVDRAAQYAWDMLTMGYRLAQPNRFDVLPDARRHYIKDRWVDEKFARRLLANSYDWIEGTQCYEEAEWWIARELGKEAFADVQVLDSIMPFYIAAEDYENEPIVHEYILAVLGLAKMSKQNIRGCEYGMMGLFSLHLDGLIAGAMRPWAMTISEQYHASSFMNRQIRRRKRPRP